MSCHWLVQPVVLEPSERNRYVVVLVHVPCLDIVSFVVHGRSSTVDEIALLKVLQISSGSKGAQLTMK